jgi:hypothetical protein
MALRRANGSGEVSLPADYVAQHVELAYATTAYRSQGRTTDTAHAVVSPATTREVLYVSATRGRESNSLYVDTSFDPDPATGHEPAPSQRTARDVLAGVLANQGSDLSAHETLCRAQGRAEDLNVLAAEYETLASAAQEQRWRALLERSGLDPVQLEQVRQSEARGPLLAALRDAEARGLDMEGVFPKLVALRSLDDAEDPASVMHARVQVWAHTAGSKRRTSTGFVAGIIPRAAGVTDPDVVRALNERAVAMQNRARKLAVRALEHGETWVLHLGAPPVDRAKHERWFKAVSTIAAYRERWNIADDRRPLGPGGAVRPLDAPGHRRRAELAIAEALRLSNEDSGHRRPQLNALPAEPIRELPAGIEL